MTSGIRDIAISDLISTDPGERQLVAILTAPPTVLRPEGFTGPPPRRRAFVRMLARRFPASRSCGWTFRVASRSNRERLK